jgi:hypothetical protein
VILKRGRELIEELMRELLPDWPPTSILGTRVSAQERWEQRQRELPTELRQRAIDSVWEATTAVRHRGLGR